jgi:hypothetical protein
MVGRIALKVVQRWENLVLDPADPLLAADFWLLAKAAT